MFLLRVPLLADTLERCGVLCRWRAGMVLDLRLLRDHPRLPPGYEIAAWDQARLKEVAEADYLAYRGSLDALLYWDYFSSPAGCERMWRGAPAGEVRGVHAGRPPLPLPPRPGFGGIMAPPGGTRGGVLRD